MPFDCIVKGCHSNSRLDKSITFFLLPWDNIQLRTIWVRLAGYDPLDANDVKHITREHSICSLHFVDNQNSLLHSSIPTLNLPIQGTIVYSLVSLKHKLMLVNELIYIHVSLTKLYIFLVLWAWKNFFLWRLRTNLFSLGDFFEVWPIEVKLQFCLLSIMGRNSTLLTFFFLGVKYDVYYFPSCYPQRDRQAEGAGRLHATGIQLSIPKG